MPSSSSIICAVAATAAVAWLWSRKAGWCSNRFCEGCSSVKLSASHQSAEDGSEEEEFFSCGVGYNRNSDNGALSEGDIVWGLCSVKADDKIIVLGHYGESEYYGYGLPFIRIYDLKTQAWSAPQYIGIAFIWWNIGWLDNPEVLSTPSSRFIFSPWNYHIGSNTVTFDALEVNTWSWHCLDCPLLTDCGDALLHCFVYVTGAIVIGLVFAPAVAVPGEEEPDPPILKMRECNILEETSKHIPYEGTPPMAWDKDAPPNAVANNGRLYLLLVTGSNFSATDACPLYIFNINTNIWTFVAKICLPVPCDFPRERIQEVEARESDFDDESAYFSRHFIVHRGIITCDVTYEDYSLLYYLDFSEQDALKWKKLCSCEGMFNSTDCYCITEDEIYHISPTSNGKVSKCTPEWHYRNARKSHCQPKVSSLRGLSVEVLLYVFSFLGRHIITLPTVCVMWRALALSPNALVVRRSWDAVRLKDINNWSNFPKEYTIPKILTADLESVLQMRQPPRAIMEKAYQTRFRMDWQRCKASMHQNPYQQYISGLLHMKKIFNELDEDENSDVTSTVVMIDRNAEILLSEVQLPRLCFVPSAKSHLFMHKLKEQCDDADVPAPNVVVPIHVLRDVVVYAAYHSKLVPPLVEVEDAKKEALEAMLISAPIMAALNTNHLKELAYLTASQPERGDNADRFESFEEYQYVFDEVSKAQNHWRNISLGKETDPNMGDIVWVFAISVKGSLLLPYYIADHVELFVK